MARIRTIKPLFFRDEVLQDLEAKHPDKYIMLVLGGLWTISNSHGIFKNQPDVIKSEILPLLNFDIKSTLQILCDNGFIDQHEGMAQLIQPLKYFGGSRSGSLMDINVKAWIRLRHFIFKRDGKICAYCNDKVGPFHIDHVIPLIKGGTDDPENLAVACRTCNIRKKDSTLGTFLIKYNLARIQTKAIA